ncbi:protein of unknown function [Arenibacter palladensis]|uniref:DUF4861 domain-containing protein n=1 Tax=Arenibacter palladensis TaxID=237373 RepID=A0A1M4UCU5_9FLAO|nr:DUF4861 family protein [Arenibacter palladensis]SHE54427.1 protein of unknown function [Arenibacter palladensis]
MILNGPAVLIRSYVLIALVAISCNGKTADKQLVVQVKNELDFSRSEVVTLSTQQLKNFLENHKKEELRIRKEGNANYLRTQWIDYDQDGHDDELLFQADAEPNSVSTYLIVMDSSVVVPESEVVAYSRLVPERTDDYTWENDKVAFRTYGPTGQKEALEGVPGSTLSSGIDLWLKRTDKSIINKWYAEHLKTPGYYHIDHGEGYDPYHVGGSRGTGGIGIFENDSLYVSQNFMSARTIAAGPPRTVFELDYASWSDYGLKETKRITLDLGSNFSKFEIVFSSEREVPNIAVGITLHENKGDAKLNGQEGWFRHWETMDSTNLGEGLVLNPTDIVTALVHKTEIRDQSNLLVITKPKNNLTYYAGFAWELSGQITGINDWDAMLSQQAKIIANPMLVSIKK